MRQLTVRGFDRELEQELRRLAKSEGLSLNQAALRLMRQGAGLAGHTPKKIGAALDKYFGSMTSEDADAIDRSVEYLDRVSLGRDE